MEIEIAFTTQSQSIALTADTQTDCLHIQLASIISGVAFPNLIMPIHCICIESVQWHPDAGWCNVILY